MLVALAATFLATFLGISTLSSGVPAYREVSNKLMWVRIGLQTVTIGLLVLAFFLR